MHFRFLSILAIALSFALAMVLPGGAGEPRTKEPPIREELWMLSLPIPMLAFVIRPTGVGPLPLVIMNHGESIDPTARGFFPTIEFRDAARWFARHGYLVVAPVRPGFGAASLDLPDYGIYGVYFGNIGECSHAEFRNPGLSVASTDQWVIDYLTKIGAALPKNVIVVGQSGGAWGAVALSSKNPPAVAAVIAFAAGRGGHKDDKPNNNCSPETLVATAGEFGRTARIPLLWISTENDSYFGPALVKQMVSAYKAAGGNVEYHLMPAFGDDGHFFVDSADAIPVWAPIVSSFLKAR